MVDRLLPENHSGGGCIISDDIRQCKVEILIAAVDDFNGGNDELRHFQYIECCDVRSPQVLREHKCDFRFNLGMYVTADIDVTLLDHMPEHITVYGIIDIHLFHLRFACQPHLRTQQFMSLLQMLPY